MGAKKALYDDGVEVSVSRGQTRIWVLHGNELAYGAKFVFSYTRYGNGNLTIAVNSK